MRQTGHWLDADTLSSDKFLAILDETIGRLDVDNARREVTPFVKRTDSLAVWSREFFLDVARRIRII